MKSALLALALVQLFAATESQAKVVQVTKMAQIFPYVAPRTLVVFDLDNTIIEPVQTLGSDQWFDHVVATNKAKGLDTSNAVSEAIRVWSNVQRYTRVEAVERDTPRMIQHLQDKGYLVIALTARPDSVRETTLKQLASVGVKFQQVIMIGPDQTKGDTLKKYLAQSSGKIQRVLFVDDKQKHVDSVNTVLGTLGNTIQHFEFRYGAADPKVHAMNLSVIACEWRIFEQTQRLVTDQQCGGISGY